MISIGFFPLGGERWHAGPRYLINAVESLTRFAPSLEPTLLAPSREGVDDRLREAFPRPSLDVRRTRNRLARYAIAAVRRTTGRDIDLGMVLRRAGIDVVFTGVAHTRPAGCAVLSWLPDAQHLVLPQRFTQEERRTRDAAFDRAARVSDRLILPSQSTLAELQAVRPDLAATSVALHPYACPADATLHVSPRTVAERYGLPERFIYAPGQLWSHKGHDDLIEALAGRAAPALTLVTTGYEEDYRNPGYVPSLTARASASGVAERWIRLGPIPYGDVLQLMRASVCVVNPSKYEGFGMTVDEARSLGVRLVLSDISAHREHAVPDAVYFRAGDPEHLRLALGSVQEWPAGPDHDRERAARVAARDRQRHYAERFVDLVQEAVR